MLYVTLGHMQVSLDAIVQASLPPPPTYAQGGPGCHFCCRAPTGLCCPLHQPHAGRQLQSSVLHRYAQGCLLLAVLGYFQLLHLPWQFHPNTAYWLCNQQFGAIPALQVSSSPSSHAFSGGQKEGRICSTLCWMGLFND